MSSEQTEFFIFPNSSDTLRQYVFPDDWLGQWKGELQIYNGTELTQTFPMALDHRITDHSDTLIWAIIYGEDSIAGRRDYQLITKDKQMGHYVVDEKNSIYLDTYLRGNKMISSFEVQNNLITLVYKREGDAMIFEIYAINTKEAKISGNQEHNGSEMPLVKSFKVNSMHKAILYK